MRIKELIIERTLFISALITVLVTAGIMLVLLSESLGFFSEVSIVDFFTDTQWTPLFSQKHYGILPLLTGTLMTTLVAIIIALPVGISIAVYLSEYAPKKFRRTVKPLLELLAAVPTVVYGFFALTVVTPALQSVLPQLETFNMLSAGLVMGIMIIPYISSMSEDAMHAVPKSLREASYGMGSTTLQTAFKVVLPSASSGIMASVILAVSRAVGETMIVAIAAGQIPNFTINPMRPAETITAYIVQVSSGDIAYGSLEHKTIFAAGITLFVFTFLLNNISFQVKKRYQRKYGQG